MADRLVLADSDTSRFYSAFIQANRPADVNDELDTTSIVTPADLDDFAGGGGGSGTVESVNGEDPDVDGDVTLTGAHIVATGYTVGTNVAVAATDTINEALGKLQAQINAILAAGYVVGLNGIENLWGGTETEYSGETPAADTVYVRIPD